MRIFPKEMLKRIPEEILNMYYSREQPMDNNVDDDYISDNDDTKNY